MNIHSRVGKTVFNKLAFGSLFLFLLALCASNAEAAVFLTWAPQGTTGGTITSPTVGGYTGSMSQTWENAKWSTSQSGQATPQAWVDSATGSNVLFACQANGNTPAFTVTMNANHTVAGIFDRPENPDPCTVTITGTGQIVMPSGLAGYDVTSDTGDPGSLTIGVVISGPGGIEGEGNGSIKGTM